MINLNDLNKYRLTGPGIIKMYGSAGNSENGAFMIKSPIDGADMFVVASIGQGWEHVSVSRKNRCPNWPEMEHAKRVFFKVDEMAMQLHVPVAAHINLAKNCLHIWKPVDQEIPVPPVWMVGPIEDDKDERQALQE